MSFFVDRYFMYLIIIFDMKKNIAIASFLALASITFAQAEVVTYYVKNQMATTAILTPSSYTLENGDTATNPIDENVALHFNAINKGTDMLRWDNNRASTVYSVTSLKSLEIWLSNPLEVKTDMTVTMGVDTGYIEQWNNLWENKYVYDRQFRLAMDTANALVVGGDLTLNTSKYFTSKFCHRNKLYYNFSIGGALNFNYTGAKTDTGYHVFQLADTASQDTNNLTFTLGGLNSTTKGVYITSAKSTDVVFNFKNNENNEFKGGSFTGVFATGSSISANAVFQMDGSGTQSIKIYKAANGEQCGLGDFADKKDMSISSVSVSSGTLIFDTEIAVDAVEINGGALKYISNEKATSFSINEGSIIYGGEVKTGFLSITAKEVNVYFDIDSFATEELSIFTYDDSDISEATIFNAFDAKTGNVIEGTFNISNNFGEGVITFTAVPEPATIAGIFGILSIAFVAYRRRK